MGLLHGNAGFVEYITPWDTIIPRPDEIYDLLQKKQIRPLERVETKNLAIGWCHPLKGIPEDFIVDHVEMKVLGLRIDTKKIPSATLSMEVGKALRKMKEESSSEDDKKKLPAKVVRSLRDRLKEDLLVDVLPATKIVEVAIDEESNSIYFGALGKALNDHFTRLYFETFGIPLVRRTPPLANAQSMDSKGWEVIDQLVPISWGRKGGEAHD